MYFYFGFFKSERLPFDYTLALVEEILKSACSWIKYCMTFFV